MKTLDQAQLTENDRSAVESAAAILRERFPVEKVILFGSKARGEDDAESDIDLLVLTRRPVTVAEKEAMTRALFDLELRCGVAISKLVVPVEAWEHGPYHILPIHREVERDGVAA